MNKSDNQKKNTLYYFTDPLCSHCWALDSTLSKFKMEYGKYFDIVTVMGGMVEDGNHYEDLHGEEANEKRKHWEEVGFFYHVPMNGNIWHTDPITSSYPASIAFLELQKTDKKKATVFLRMVREGAFLFQENVAKREVLSNYLSKLNILNKNQILDVAFSNEGKKILYENIQPMLDLGVNGFPTVVIVNDKNEGIKVVGSRTYETYKKALRKMTPEDQELVPDNLQKLPDMLDQFPSLFYYEIEKFYNLDKNDVENFIIKEMGNMPFKTSEVDGYPYIQK